MESTQEELEWLLNSSLYGPRIRAAVIDALTLSAVGCELEMICTQKTVKMKDLCALAEFIKGTAIVKYVTKKKELTRRHTEVVELLTSGYTVTNIAALFGCSEKTVESHRAAAQKKLKIWNLADLTRYALRTGLIDAE